jgi:Ca2+-binding EF-hand superfamily protein
VGSPQGNPLTAEACFLQLADRDNDGILSAGELTSVEKRLKMRDADDNELIDSYELLGAKADAYQVSRRVSPAAILLLTEETDWADLAKLLKAKYAAENGSLGNGEPRLTGLTTELNGNSNRALDATELRRLLTAEPHVRAEVNLGESDPKPRGAFIKSLSNSLRDTAKISPLAEDQKQTLLEISGIRMAVHGMSLTTPVNSYVSIARSEMKRNDKDNNGYLDEKEAPRQFSLWDADGDKKVFEKEIVAFYTEGAMMARHRIYVVISNEPKELFKLVDVNNDGRLSPRELSEAKQHLLGLDANKNGQLDAEEFPRLLRLTFSRGTNPNEGSRIGRGFLPPNLRRMDSSGDWFTQMDANGDGDISQREFLGTPQQFESFDKNHDGLLAREETAVAK